MSTKGLNKKAKKEGKDPLRVLRVLKGLSSLSFCFFFAVALAQTKGTRSFRANAMAGATPDISAVSTALHLASTKRFARTEAA